MFDWNDLKTFLAVAREGSTLGAAKTLGVNQTTVARRIEALEAAVGLKLFERGQTGSRLTEAGQELVADAERMAQEAAAFANRAQAVRRGTTGALRVTISEALANAFLAPALGPFRTLYPDIKVEMLVSEAFLDLEKGEADLAIRGTAAAALEDSALIARKLADVDWGIYCSRDYAIRHGIPARADQIQDHVLIGGDGDLASMAAMRWMTERASRAEVHTRSNSLTNLIVAAKAGLGLAPLPKLIVDQEPQLCLCMDIPDFPSAIHILTRPDMKDTPRVRAFIDFLVPHFGARRRALEEAGRANQAAIAQSVAEARALAGQV